jgi:hypothetical protein
MRAAIAVPDREAADGGCGHGAAREMTPKPWRKRAGLISYGNPGA